MQELEETKENKMARVKGVTEGRRTAAQRRSSIVPANRTIGHSPNPAGMAPQAGSER